MTTQDELGTKLKTLGIRLTPQRLAIAEVVVNSGDHPSVKEILPFQKQSRYDANLSPHANLVCVGCGSVHDADVGQGMVSELRERLEGSSDFLFTGQRVDFYGWCPNCAHLRDHRSDSSGG